MQKTKDDYLIFPTDVYINLTSRCNLRCRHCFGDYGIGDPNELSLKEWKSVIDEIDAKDGFQVILSGGEPTLFKRFSSLISYINKIKLHYSIVSNGLFPLEILDHIIKNSEFLNSIQISLDGFTPEMFGFLRYTSKGKNLTLFDKVMKNILRLKKNKINVIIACVIHRKNYTHMEEFLTFLQEHDLRFLKLSDLSIAGRAIQFFDKIYAGSLENNIEYWKSLKTACKQKDISVDFIDMPYIKFDTDGSDLKFNCPAAISYLDISSTGIISPCPLSRLFLPSSEFPFESVRNKSINQIWNGSLFDKFRKLRIQGCDGCKNKDMCGRCVAQSYHYFNDYNAPPPFCLKVADLLKINKHEEYKEVLEKKWEIKI